VVQWLRCRLSRLKYEARHQAFKLDRGEMTSISGEGSEHAPSVLADDHSEIDILIGELLAALEEGLKSKAFARSIFCGLDWLSTSAPSTFACSLLS
jgi:hypothetical protein